MTNNNTDITTTGLPTVTPEPDVDLGFDLDIVRLVRTEYCSCGYCKEETVTTDLGYFRVSQSKRLIRYTRLPKTEQNREDTFFVLTTHIDAPKRCRVPSITTTQAEEVEFQQAVKAYSAKRADMRTANGVDKLKTKTKAKQKLSMFTDEDF